MIIVVDSGHYNICLNFKFFYKSISSNCLKQMYNVALHKICFLN